MAYFLLFIGFIVLVKGADYFVSSSSSIARHFKIPPIIIGLTIVAFGTSAPEAAVSISAAIKGNEGITIGNVIGSNIINISLIVGLTAFIFPLKVEKSTIIKEIPFALLGSIVLLILLLDNLLGNEVNNALTRGDGLILLAFFSIFLYYIIEVAIKSKPNPHLLIRKTDVKNKLSNNIFLFFIGITGVIFGGWLVVENATSIALSLGMSQTLVGLTIIAIGTSLPELVTALTAALKKESEIALGNIIGSNIFNIFFVLGISSLIRPLLVDDKILFDLLLMIGLTSILLFVSFTNKRRITRLEGILLVIIYLSYLTFILIRN